MTPIQAKLSEIKKKTDRREILKLGEALAAGHAMHTGFGYHYMEGFKKAIALVGDSDIPKLIETLEKAIEQRDEMIPHIWTGDGESLYETDRLNAELAAILEADHAGKP